MKFSLTENAAASRLFTAAIFKEFARKGRSPAFSRLIGQLRSVRELPGERSVGDAFQVAFKILRSSGNRDEYIYKAALTQRVLLGTHNLNTASMLTEFRTGARKADLVILNGTSTVYEIKSERDSLGRLAGQLDAYKRVFARAFVIASEQHLPGILKIVPDDVGILSLSDRGTISEVRPAEHNPGRISPETLFESLRKDEAAEILSRLGVEIPAVPNTKLYNALRVEFCKLDPAIVHGQMVHVLKKTRNLAPLRNLVSGLPNCLQPAALSYPIRRIDHNRVLQTVQTPLEVARKWV